MARGKGREGSGGFVLSSGAAKTASRNASFFAPDQAGISTSSGRRRETECVCEREREREGGGRRGRERVTVSRRFAPPTLSLSRLGVVVMFRVLVIAQSALLGVIAGAGRRPFKRRSALYDRFLRGGRVSRSGRSTKLRFLLARISEPIRSSAVRPERKRRAARARGGNPAGEAAFLFS